MNFFANHQFFSFGEYKIVVLLCFRVWKKTDEFFDEIGGRFFFFWDRNIKKIVINSYDYGIIMIIGANILDIILKLT